jgi:hypothetical protein
MNIALALVLLISVCLTLGWAVVSLIQNLTEQAPFDEPAFREPGPIFVEHVEQQVARSQFAWQSRSHWRAPD